MSVGRKGILEGKGQRANLKFQSRTEARHNNDVDDRTADCFEQVRASFTPLERPCTKISLTLS